MSPSMNQNANKTATASGIAIRSTGPIRTEITRFASGKSGAFIQARSAAQLYIPTLHGTVAIAFGGTHG